MRSVAPLGAVVVAVSLAVTGCVSTQRGELASRDFPVSVDYGRSVEDLLHEGSYDWVYSEVSSANFPAGRQGNGSLTLRLVAFGNARSVEKFLAAEQSQGLRPADLRELLAFGAAYPDVQRYASVIAFGSFKKYTTVEYQNWGMLGPMGPPDMERVIAVQNFYPALIHGLFGRSVALIQEDTIPAFDPGGFYGCFVVTPPR